MTLDAADSKYVYIIDDNFFVSQSIHFWLSVRGYDPRSFATPVDFLEDLDNLKPGCVLLDVRMPTINGIQMLEKYGFRLQQMKVIMMTGHADVGTALTAMELGAVDLIEKPFKPDVLIEAIEKSFQNLAV